MRAACRHSSRLAVVVTLAALAMVLSGCVVASPDTDTYDDAVAKTVGTAISETATVEKLLRLLVSGDIPRPAVVAQMRYSEQSLERASSWFTRLNPPVGSDSTRDRLSDLLDEASDLLGQARVAIHRDRKSEYPGVADALGGLADRLERLEAAAS